ncbi:MAG: hypothetical protein JSV20_04700 [Candidatus Bathyarchaeota archaeon]|nr:MAG: hypothetical protein JSV20_04700 [Candidatus Bathyarchaeota archaeon]
MNTRELALIAVFSALWISAQITLGPVIGQITNVHGVIQRFLGWFLMLIMAELTEKFGRVTLLSIIASLVTRIVRRTASLYPWVLASGYVLGGFIFDLLFFFPVLPLRNLKNEFNTRFLLIASLVSGLCVLVPYLAFQFYFLGFHVFILKTPVYVYAIVKGVSLNLLGTIVSMSIMPRLKNAITFKRDYWPYTRTGLFLRINNFRRLSQGVQIVLILNTTKGLTHFLAANVAFSIS